MILVKLSGGLGNQMFQYAAGKALAVKFNVKLVLDTSFLEKATPGNYTQRNFELGVFNIIAEHTNMASTPGFYKFTNTPYLLKLQKIFPKLFKHTYFSETGHAYQKRFSALKDNTYLDGYWQCENYFLSIRDVLLRDFSIKKNKPSAIASLENKILAAKTSVSLHIRRGDYVSHPSASAFHGVLSPAYYYNALEKISGNSIQLFIFSDDLKWCEENLVFKFPVTYVRHTEHACWDIYLMSRCSHNIIANSSFSWWAAWLNTHPQKKVLVPPFWFNNVKTADTGILACGWQIVEETT